MRAALFDLDGVILDTEGQYEKFWQVIGRKHLTNHPDFAYAIKGMSLVQIYQAYFADRISLQQEITRELNAFELQMNYPYFDGVVEFLEQLQQLDVTAVVVTSSNKDKMRRVYAEHPELPSFFSHVFTAEHVRRSKPEPDCYLNAANVIGRSPQDCIVFEDSLNGIKAGHASGAHVVGLATSFSQEMMLQGEFSGLCELVINEFREFPIQLLAD